MCQARIWLLGLLVLSIGCDIFQKSKCDNPVVGPPPPRLNVSDAETPKPFAGTARVAQAFPRRRTQLDQLDDVVTVGGESPHAGGFVDGAVVATINGSPIFAYEILEPYSERLAEIEKKYPPAAVQKFCNDVIQQNLKSHIDEKLLGQAFQRSLTREQREMLTKHLDGLFEKQEIVRLQKALEVSTQHELELELTKRNTSLEGLRRTFESRQIAREYLHSRVPPDREIGRPELLAYYQAHIDEYTIASRVKWQEIKVDYARHGGREKSIEILEQAVAELQRGVDFGAVAKKYSDGPTAADGGNWSWTQKGSLADATVDQALFEIPIGGISAIIDGKDGFALVKVLEREQASRVPLAEVQEKIKQKLREDARRRGIQQVIDELRETAVIEILDSEHIQPASG